MDTQDKHPEDELISGYLNGELTPEETRRLMNWISLSDENKKHYDEFCEIWITSRAFSGKSGYDAEQGFRIFKDKISSVKDTPVHRLDFRTLLKYAAIVLIAFSAGGGFFYYSGKSSVSDKISKEFEISVPLGSRAKMTLPDGSVVTLNAGSDLKYTDSHQSRTVWLEGEGFFAVAKDPERPFTVSTEYMNVVATGTEFNVKAYPSDSTVEATLISGSVRIENLLSGKNEETVLKPNQKFTYYKVNNPVSYADSASINLPPRKVDKPEIKTLVKENVNVERIISWKENRLIFEKESLSAIAIELERKYDVQIIFESERLRSSRFSGIIVNEPIEQVLEAMSWSAPISYRLDGRTITLSGNKRFEEINKNLYNKNQ